MKKLPYSSWENIEFIGKLKTGLGTTTDVCRFILSILNRERSNTSMLDNFRIGYNIEVTNEQNIVITISYRI
jgi:hypothetical protein